jgi:hypothetical protein
MQMLRHAGYAAFADAVPFAEINGFSRDDLQGAHRLMAADCALFRGRP